VGHGTAVLLPNWCSADNTGNSLLQPLAMLLGSCPHNHFAFPSHFTAPSPQLLATARREVRLLRRCANRHPNLVNLHGVSCR